MYKFIIPLKTLSWNSAYKIARNKMILSGSGRKFKEYCSEFLKEQYTEDRLLEKNLKVKIIFQYKENRKKIDVDNGFKLLIDSMKGIIFKDDCQIYDLRGIKEIGMLRDEIQIFIEELKQMEALKTFDVKELLKRQAMLDDKFDEKETVNVRTIEGIQVALITEIGELSQELKSEWNYWKNSTEKFDKSRVLEELSDVLHFYLSYINVEDEETRGRVIPFLDEFLVEYNRGVLSKQSLEGKLLALSDFRTLNENKVLGCILDISDYARATEKEFLQIHHEKWLKNMNERTKESY